MRTKCGSRRYFSGSLAVFKERGEPEFDEGEPHDYGGLFSPPKAAKNVRANLRIDHKTQLI